MWAWISGKNKTDTPELIEEAHVFIRKWLADNVSGVVSEGMTILFCGNVNLKNVADYIVQPNIDGFLLGCGVSTGSHFKKIIKIVN